MVGYGVVVVGFEGSTCWWIVGVLIFLPCRWLETENQPCHLLGVGDIELPRRGIEDVDTCSMALIVVSLQLYRGKN